MNEWIYVRVLDFVSDGKLWHYSNHGNKKIRGKCLSVITYNVILSKYVYVPLREILRHETSTFELYQRDSILL